MNPYQDFALIVLPIIAVGMIAALLIAGFTGIFSRMGSGPKPSALPTERPKKK